MPTQCHHFILGMIVLLAISLHGNAAPAPKTLKPAQPAVVVVKRADGTSVRGQLVSSDGRHVSIKPAEGKTFGDAVEIAWGDIKTVSNGLTQSKARDAWKLEHKDELCETCHGEQIAVCSTCKGTGHDPASSNDCKTCNGAQQVACKAPKCEKGMIPCPGPCLKLSEGTWKMQDGKRVRTFKIKGGTAWVSDGHIGQIVKFNAAGDIDLQDCPTCGRTGKVACPTCHGTALVACPTCKSDKTAADCAACEDGTQLCKTCNGSGTTTPAPLAKAAPPPTPAAPATPAQPAKPAPAVKPGDGLD